MTKNEAREMKLWYLKIFPPVLVGFARNVLYMVGNKGFIHESAILTFEIFVPNVWAERSIGDILVIDDEEDHVSILVLHWSQENAAQEFTSCKDR